MHNIRSWSGENSHYCRKSHTHCPENLKVCAWNWVITFFRKHFYRRRLFCVCRKNTLTPRSLKLWKIMNWTKILIQKAPPRFDRRIYAKNFFLFIWTMDRQMFAYPIVRFESNSYQLQKCKLRQQILREFHSSDFCKCKERYCIKCPHVPKING